MAKNRKRSKRAGLRGKEAPTQRGIDVSRRILDTAHKLLQENFVDDISIAKLAREAGVVRASLLYQFPEGWQDVAWRLLHDELDGQYLDWLDQCIDEAQSKPLAERLQIALEQIIDRAESTGLLYPNLRAQMFIWGEGNQATITFIWQDIVWVLMELVGKDGTNLDEDLTILAIESLLNLAFDLAAYSSLFNRDISGRRAVLKGSIKLTVRGLLAES